MHQAKGLEWRAVFVIWLADGRFPLRGRLATPDDEEEERRLFYVAATRAKDELALVYPLTALPQERRARDPAAFPASSRSCRAGTESGGSL